MPASIPYEYRFTSSDGKRVHYKKFDKRYCIQKVHKDFVFFRCDHLDNPVYSMPMPDEHHFDRLVLP